jgi:PAS domain S-box-containing protein
MTANETGADPRTIEAFPWLSRWAAGVLVVSTVAFAVIADYFTPRNILLPAVYAVPLVLCAWVADRRFLWGMTAALVALNFAQFYIGREPLHPANELSMTINRWLSAAKIVTVAVVVHFLIGARRRLEAQTLAIARYCDELAEANKEINQREEEIVRQNEELQSQAEELERQSEELRLANDELASREKMLEQLLELSRALTPELTRLETLQSICDALGTLSGNLPIAVLERRDHELMVTCHNGFGPDGPKTPQIPYAESFSALVVGRGQTGYLEDLSLRPELKVPQPAQGEPFRAVLAAPLKVRGRIIGTIELYARHKRSWGEAQVILVESLAAQTAISLAAAELVDAIQQERRRFESAFRTVPFGMMVAEDTEATQVHINPAGAAMLGVPVGENLSPGTPAGARVRRYIFKNERPVRHEDLPLSRALRGEEVQGEELGLSFPTGKRLSLLASAAPLYDSGGRVAGAVCAFADITEMKNLQRELDMRRREAEETSVRKTRFLAAVSHDIRTPVNAINLMAEVIKRYAGDPAVATQIPELARKLQANALSLVELVSDVLDVARFDSGKIEVIESEFDLHELLSEECRQLQPLAQDKGIDMRLESADRPIWLRTDRVKLARIISNLVGNAIKFTEQGNVVVRTALTADVERRVLVHVSDTGVGIPPEHQAAIFDEFAQVHNPERDRTKGTGLGLAICKRLVSVMGGALSVDSQPGKGSTFTIALPASCVLLRITHGAPSSAAAAPSAEAGNALAGLCVLLVEDHATTREGTARILTGEGATVLEADGGRSALEMLRHGGIDIVLLDMMMPDLDGREVLRAIAKERPPGLKGVLVLTGDLTPERLEEVKRLGADGLISKPIDVRVLAGTLKTFHQSKRN